jgi:hypothetical protein
MISFAVAAALGAALSPISASISLGAFAYCGYRLLAGAMRNGYIRPQKEPIRYWVRVILMTVFCVLGLWIGLIRMGLSKIGSPNLFLTRAKLIYTVCC